jgi:hypothetical protein
MRRSATWRPDGLDAGEELGHRERLGDVVVGAHPQGVHLELHGVLRREDEDGGADAAVAEGAQDLEPRHPGEAEIEHQEVEVPGARRLERGLPVADQLHGVLLLGEPAGHVLPYRAVVLNDQDAHGRAGRR